MKKNLRKCIFCKNANTFSYMSAKMFCYFFVFWLLRLEITDFKSPKSDILIAPCWSWDKGCRGKHANLHTDTPNNLSRRARTKHNTEKHSHWRPGNRSLWQLLLRLREEPIFDLCPSLITVTLLVPDHLPFKKLQWGWLMRGSQSTDYDWIIYDIIYILITLTRGSREPSPQANANKTLLLAADWVQTGLEFKHQPGIEFQRGEDQAGGVEGEAEGLRLVGVDWDGEGWDCRHLLVNRLTQGCVILLA